MIYMKFCGSKPLKVGSNMTLFVLVTEYCSYKGDLYQQGQLWYDGCDLSCRCENSTSNLFRCQERYCIKTFINIRYY